MKLLELLKELQDISVKIQVATPYLCGGVPRDKYMKRLDNIEDIDITNGSKEINYLSQELASKLKQKYNVNFKQMPDGHSTLFIGNLKMDFSSNFIVPNIDYILQQMKINNSSSLFKEVISRDFTCNSLLMTTDLTKILDPLKMGFKDINDRKIRTCLAPEITLTSNRNRVVRAIYLACKLGFDIDDSIINYVNKNPQSVKISTEKVTKDKLTDAFKRDPDKASFLITKMNLWNHIPIINTAYPYYRKFLQGKPKTAGPNYDLGKGLYSNLDKYDSVEDFREKGPHGPGVLMSKIKDVNNIDFPIDDQIGSDPIVGNSGSSYFDSVPISYMEGYTDLPDQDNKPESNLDFGEDLTDETSPNRGFNEENLKYLMDKYLTSTETGLFGLPDGIEQEGHDADRTEQIEQPYTGTSDIGTQMYSDTWNV